MTVVIPTRKTSGEANRISTIVWIPKPVGVFCPGDPSWVYPNPNSITIVIIPTKTTAIVAVFIPSR